MTNPPVGDSVPPSAPEPELPAWAKPRAPSGQVPETEMAVFIGRKWERTYRRKFAPFLEDSSFVPTWNWSAALSAGIAMPFWFIYRKLYLVFAAFFVTGRAAFFTGGAAPFFGAPADALAGGFVGASAG